MESDKGAAIRAELEEVEAALRRLDETTYRMIDQWQDSELYGGLYGAGGVNPLPIQHLAAIREVLRMRAKVHRARRVGTIGHFRDIHFDSERGTEFMAHAIDACLAHLGAGDTLPEYKRWHEFLPKWKGEA